MPPEVVEILNKAFNEALADPKIQKRIADLGGEPTPMTPAQFGKLSSDETEKWAKVVKAANFRSSDVASSSREVLAQPLVALRNTVLGRAVDSHRTVARPILEPVRISAFESTDAYFFMCLAKKSVVRCHARSRLSLLKLPRSSQWKPWPPSL